MADWIGLDIGGANLKAATVDGHAVQIAFPLWDQLESLGDTLHELISASEFKSSTKTNIAVTMTGELADCFPTKREGVIFICEQSSRLTDQGVLFYQTNGRFVNQSEAVETWRETAASNWHAIARWLGQHLPDKNGFLIDIGSTSTDMIPIRNGEPACRTDQSDPYVTDRTRLANGELVYVGTGRTPVCSIVDSVSLDGKTTGVANEWFATVKDAYIVLGELPAEPECNDSADGRSFTLKNSEQRLARMVCDDAIELGSRRVKAIATQVHTQLMQCVTTAIETVLSSNSDLPHHFVIAGSGSWLAQKAVQRCLKNREHHLIRLPYDDRQLSSAAAVAMANLASDWNRISSA